MDDWKLTAVTVVKLKKELNMLVSLFRPMLFSRRSYMMTRISYSHDRSQTYAATCQM